jgi:ABC-type transport system involved in cytochrome c biogenesis permease subunit
MRGPPPSGATGASPWAATLSPLAIVALVIVLGAAAYLWYQGYMRSRAALIVLAGIVVVLVYLGFFAMRPPT